jgi:hypothetical protein
MLQCSWRFVAFLAVAAMIVGCNSGGSDSGAVKTGGVVTLDGQPVEGATVSFSPASGGKAASGITDSSGRFSLTTLEAGDGAMPGNYGVTVVKMAGGSEPAAQPKTMEEAMKAGLNKGGPGTKVEPAKSLLPEKYNSTATSGLTAEVKSSGENDFEFKLTN